LQRLSFLKFGEKSGEKEKMEINNLRKKRCKKSPSWA